MHLNFTEHSHIVHWNVQFSPTIHTNNSKIHQYDSLSGYGSIPGLVVVLNNIWIKYQCNTIQKKTTNECKIHMYNVQLKSLKQCVLLCSLFQIKFLFWYIMDQICFLFVLLLQYTCCRVLSHHCLLHISFYFNIIKELIYMDKCPLNVTS